MSAPVYRQVFVAFSDPFVAAEIVMTLIAVLIQAILGLVNGILTPLVSGPFGEPLRQLINSILKLIPV